MKPQRISQKCIDNNNRFLQYYSSIISNEISFDYFFSHPSPYIQLLFYQKVVQIEKLFFKHYIRN